MISWKPLYPAARHHPRLLQWLKGKGSACKVGDLREMRLRSPGQEGTWSGNGDPLQYSCQENPMDRGARWATVHGL